MRYHRYYAVRCPFAANIATAAAFSDCILNLKCTLFVILKSRCIFGFVVCPKNSRTRICHEHPPTLISFSLNAKTCWLAH